MVSNVNLHPCKQDDDLSITDFIVCDEDGCGHLIISGDKGVWDDVIAQATTFTCAVGPALNTW